MAAILTNEGKRRITELLVEEETLAITEMVFAFIPGMGGADIPDPDMALPMTLLHRQDIDRMGLFDGQTVIYSAVLGAAVGDFVFNFIGLVTADQLLVAAAYQPVQTKSATSGFASGNTLYKNFALKLDNASQITGITIPAEAWQTAGSLVDMIATHNRDANAHEALKTRIMTLVSQLIDGAGHINETRAIQLVNSGIINSGHINEDRAIQLINGAGHINEARALQLINGANHASVVAQWHEGVNFYRKYSDGFIIQGGMFPAPANEKINTVNLHTPFASTAYVPIVTIAVAEGATFFQCKSEVVSVSTFKIGRDGAGQAGIYWQAAGY